MNDGGDGPMRGVAEQLFKNPNEEARQLGALIQEVAGPWSQTVDGNLACPDALRGNTDWMVKIYKALPGTTDRRVVLRLQDVPWASGLEMKSYYDFDLHAHTCIVSTLKRGPMVKVYYIGENDDIVLFEHIHDEFTSGADVEMLEGAFVDLCV